MTEKLWRLAQGAFLSLKPFFDHLMSNMYLASPEGQRLFADARKLFVCCCMAKSNVANEEQEELLGQLFGALCEYLMKEYAKSALALGYDIDDSENHADNR